MNTTFSIDTQNNVARHDPGFEIPDGSAVFSSEAELATLAESWPATRLVHIWNALPGVRPVRKVTDRKTAIRRIWAALHVATPAGTAGTPRIPAKRSAPKPKSATAKRATTKTERVIALLRRPEGATLKAIVTATVWQPHSVRGFISAQLSKRMGLRLKSFTREGQRVYRIRG